MNTNLCESTIKVLLVDDHKSFSDGLAMLINSSKKVMKVVGMASNSRETLSVAEQVKPDIVLLDVELGEENGIEILPRLIENIEAKFIILTGTQNPLVHETAILSGARGVLLKTDPAIVILKAIEKVYRGELWLNNNTLNNLLSRMARQTGASGGGILDPEEEKIAALTNREREIIKALVKNDSSTNKEISDHLYISDSTLKNHLTTIYSKLEVKNRIELLKFALKHNLGKQ
jgi:two-component system nitrate/nitrite response regulator NarL